MEFPQTVQTANLTDSVYSQYSGSEKQQGGRCSGNNVQRLCLNSYAMLRK